MNDQDHRRRVVIIGGGFAGGDRQPLPDVAVVRAAHRWRAEYAYDRDPILGSGTEQINAAAAENQWTVIDMAADWSAVHPPFP